MWDGLAILFLQRIVTSSVKLLTVCGTQQENSNEASLWKPEDSSYSQCLIFKAHFENRKYPDL